MSYSFFYDETEHSRKINYQTVTANNYYDNFSAAIVGWNNENADEICKRYKEFEAKQEYRKKKGELKSQTMKQKDLKYGFATLNKHTIEFYEDLLSTYDENTVLNLSVFSKIEYVIHQVFRDYHNSVFVDIDYMKYSIIKAILVYRPQKVIEAIYNSTDEFVNELCIFFQNRIQLNKSNLKLKERENIAFEQILVLLNDVNQITSLDWKYYGAFNGFSKLLQEMNIQDYVLIIDEEGELHSTFLAAETEGIINISEGNSKEFVGIRMADMLIGLVSKMMQSLKESLTSNYSNEKIEKRLLEPGWFILDDRQLGLYNRLHTIICVNNKYWYNTYSGVYSDDLVVFVSLLQFMSRFENAEELRNANYDMQPEYFNSFVCSALQRRFDILKNKLPIEPIVNDSKEYFYNKQGAKVYKDISKQPQLPLKEGNNLYLVLSVGIGKEGIPFVTIEEEGEAVCYNLLLDYSEWAMTVVGIANSGEKLIPGQVVFSLMDGKYYADII